MTSRKLSTGPHLDEWSTREKLVLACSVLRSGDQNWHSVSRTIKPICDMTVQRPPDWFSQKSCAYQYGALLDSAETPKRKRASTETGRQETPQEQILRKLTFERIEELKKSIKQDHERYKKIKKDIEKIRSGKINDQLSYIWSQLQSGKGVPIEELIPESSADSSSKAMLGSPQQQPSPNTASQQRSRSQRVPKATERFQAFQAQLQKQQQRYQQQHQGPGTPGQSPNVSTSMQMSPTEANKTPTQSTVVTSPETTTASTPLKVVLPSISVGSQETPSRQLSYQSPSQSPQKLETGPSGTETPFLSSLLVTPTSELRTVVAKQAKDEQMKPFITTEESHHDRNVPIMSVAKENLIVYRSVSQPVSPEGPASDSAPTLSKLLELGGNLNTDAVQGAQPDEAPQRIEAEQVESTKRKLSQSEEIEVAEPPPKKRPVETTPVPLPIISSTPTHSPSPSLADVQKPRLMEELTISVGEPSDIQYIPSPVGSKVKKSRGRPRKPGLIRKAQQPSKLSESGDVEETLSVDDDISERDDTESEAASVTDKEFMENDQDDESRSAADDDDCKYQYDITDASRLPSFGKGRGRPQPLTPSSVSPSSPALSTGSSCMDPEASQAQKNWRKSIMLVWKAAASHKYANVFLHPVTDDEAPGYHTIVYRPMDLATIKKNIENGLIRSTSEFQRDMMLMFQNALLYNRSDHDVYHMAEEMRDDVMEQIQYFIATQLHLMEQSSDKDARMLRGHRSDVFHFFL